jgi:hypothetical protein
MRKRQGLKKTLLVLVCASLPMASAWAGPYDQPYALIESGRSSAPHKQVPVAVTKIDGVSTRSTMKADPVSPGKRRVTLSFSSSARTVVEEPTKEIEIDAEPCKRYRIVAHYDVALSGKWDPQVQAVEDIGECKRKFMKNAPAK